MTATSAQADLCYACHAGGDTFDVQAQFSGVPANNDTSDAYYSHPVSAASAAQHDLGTDDEFRGVLNRHSVCSDCHNPHDATATRPAQSTTGWTASGAVRGASGVSVQNGSAAAAPTYALITRSVGGGSLTYEYELCLKCHSGYTVLPTRTASNPSWWALDKGIELNPANTSFHPVEAVGRNVSAQMAASLAGSSPFKAWTLRLDSTVRCTQCHGDPSTVNQTGSATPLQPAADANEAAHGSPNRGLLTAPYRDRALKPQGEAYSATDFGLCYLCHAERPFVDPNVVPSAPDTSFTLHGKHVSNLRGRSGTSLSIDSGTDGGLAICAECHFRIHSTAIAYSIGDTAPVVRASGYPSLVGFAPDVRRVGTVDPTWNQPNSQGVGSCTLTCHGFTHLASATTYTVAPATGFTAAPTSGAAGSSGLTVQFSDATRYIDPASSTWTWDFGDGTTSNLQNPSHTYAQGTYTVKLTVRRTLGNNLEATSIRTDYIAVGP